MDVTKENLPPGGRSKNEANLLWWWDLGIAAIIVLIAMVTPTRLFVPAFAGVVAFALLRSVDNTAYLFGRLLGHLRAMQDVIEAAIAEQKKDEEIH